MEASLNSKIATSEYLNLLTIQLQNQDPINPVKQEDFISQLSQFSTLEGVQSLNASFESMLKLREISQGLELVGKNVKYLDVNSGAIKGGVVDEFFVEQGQINLMVGGERLSIDLIAGVKAN